MPIDITKANFDLLSVGVAVAAIGVLGFLVYFNNRRSITNKSFLFLSIATIFWGISNYLEYKFNTTTSILWALRAHIFISTIHALSFFQLAYVFPQDDIKFPKWYKFVLLPIVGITAVLTLTSFVFARVLEIAPLGEVTNPERGPGIALFTIIAFGLLLAGVVFLIRKAVKFVGVQRRQTIFILIGMLSMACLILLFNLIMPVVLNNLKYIPLAALFVLPFISLTSYTIYRHKLFNVRVAATGILAFFITAFSFTNIIFSSGASAITLNTTAFVVILIGSIQLVRGMINLEIANEQQENLIHFISHEVKGYLTNDQAALSGILEGDFGPITPETRTIAEGALASTRKGADTVKDILAAANLKKGTVKYNIAPFDMKAVTLDVISQLQETAKAKGLTIETNIKDEDFHFSGDKDQIEQHVVRNLIDNSIKYTQTGKLTVGLEHKAGKILFSVKDTGVGITPEDMSKLFTQGGHGKDSIKVNVNSTGYGLYIAKSIVLAHGGRIWAESEGAGKGSQFYAEF